MRDLLLDRERLLHTIGRALSTQKNQDALLEMILEGAKNLTDADGGTIYLAKADQKLKFAIVRTDSLGLFFGGETGQKPDAFEEISYAAAAPTAIVSYVAATKQLLNIADVYETPMSLYKSVYEFDKKRGYKTRSVLTVPIIDHEQQLKAVMQLINPLSGNGFSQQDEQLVLSLASQAGVALSNLILVHSLKALFEAFSASIAEAIDVKSPVTGRHEERVPILTMMLADALQNRGDITFTESQLYELKIAALLHDCGKLTTPDYLLEKKNKLEGPFDRVELIDMRLLLKKKELEISHLKAELNAEEFASEIAKIEEAKEFIHHCNSCPLSSLEQTKLGSLKNLGLITEEEWAHLVVAQGNLTSKERDIMKEHVTVTYKMLSQLPFPKEIAHVADIAASHHEKLDGTGYPRGLSGSQISLPARILTIADIFEALSAPDRPYKKPITLSQVINLMTKMAEDGQIDHDLFKYFLKSRVFNHYANQYLSPDQIDVA